VHTQHTIVWEGRLLVSDGKHQVRIVCACAFVKGNEISEGKVLPKHMSNNHKDGPDKKTPCFSASFCLDIAEDVSARYDAIHYQWTNEVSTRD